MSRQARTYFSSQGAEKPEHSILASASARAKTSRRLGPSPVKKGIDTDNIHIPFVPTIGRLSPEQLKSTTPPERDENRARGRAPGLSRAELEGPEKLSAFERQVATTPASKMDQLALRELRRRQEGVKEHVTVQLARSPPPAPTSTRNHTAPSGPAAAPPKEASREREPVGRSAREAASRAAAQEVSLSGTAATARQLLQRTAAEPATKRAPPPPKTAGAFSDRARRAASAIEADAEAQRRATQGGAPTRRREPESSDSDERRRESSKAAGKATRDRRGGKDDARSETSHRTAPSQRSRAASRVPSRGGEQNGESEGSDGETKTFEGELDDIENRLKHCEASRARLKKQLAKRDAEVKSLEAALDAAQAELERATGTIEALSAGREGPKRALSSELEIVRVQEELAKSEQARVLQDARIAALAAQLAQKEDECKRFHGRQSKGSSVASVDYAALIDENGELRARQHSDRDALSEAKAVDVQRSARVSELERHLADAAADNRELIARVTDAEAKLATQEKQFDAQLKALEEAAAGEQLRFETRIAQVRTDLALAQEELAEFRRAPTSDAPVATRRLAPPQNTTMVNGSVMVSTIASEAPSGGSSRGGSRAPLSPQQARVAQNVQAVKIATLETQCAALRTENERLRNHHDERAVDGSVWNAIPRQKTLDNTWRALELEQERDMLREELTQAFTQLEESKTVDREAKGSRLEIQKLKAELHSLRAGRRTDQQTPRDPPLSHRSTTTTHPTHPARTYSAPAAPDTDEEDRSTAHRDNAVAAAVVAQQALQDELDAVHAECDKLRAEKDTTTNENTVLTAEWGRTRAELTALRTDAAAQQQTERERSAELAQLKEQLERVASELKSVEDDRNKLQQTLEQQSKAAEERSKARTEPFGPVLPALPCEACASKSERLTVYKAAIASLMRQLREASSHLRSMEAANPQEHASLIHLLSETHYHDVDSMLNGSPGRSMMRGSMLSGWGSMDKDGLQRVLALRDEQLANAAERESVYAQRLHIMTEQLARKQDELVVIQGKMTQLSARLDGATQFNDDIEKLTAALASKEADLALLQVQLGDAQRAVAATEDALRRASEERARYEKLNATRTNEVLQHRHEVQDLRIQLAIAVKQAQQSGDNLTALTLLEEELRVLRGRESLLQEELSIMRVTHERDSEHLHVLSEQLTTTRSDLESATLRSQRLQADNAHLTTEVGRKDAGVKSLTHQLLGLKDKLSQLGL